MPVPSDQPKALGDALAGQGGPSASPVQSPSIPPDLDLIGAEYLKRAYKLACCAHFNAFTADRRALLLTDWDHPGLRPYRAQIDRVRGWSCSFPGLLLAGPTGRGKTRSALALLRRLMCEEYLDCSCWSAQSLAARITQEQAYGRDEAAGFVAALARHEILFIDDLGQESVLRSQEDRVDSWIFDLLDRRLCAQLPCIITTNLPADQLGSGLRHAPFVRRLLDLCGVQPVDFR